MPAKRLKELWRQFLHFSQRERRRVLLFLPLLVVISLLFLWEDRPRFERGFTQYTDLLLDSAPGGSESFSADSHFRADRSGDLARGELNSGELFYFDPNTIDLEALVALGFTPKQAQGILNYRRAGAQFRIAEDFSRCFTVSSKMFSTLRPYIRIEHSGSRGGSIDPDSSVFTPGEELLNCGGGPSPALTHEENLSQSTPSSGGSLIEINSADSLLLVTIRGIGALTAGRIVRYRQRLGGFVYATQLGEVLGMTDQNYQLISQQIFVDSSKIKKIDINFATPEQMNGHPYLPPRVVDKILKNRQLKGGWSSTEEMIEQHIFTSEQALRLWPYLYFRKESLSDR